MQDHRTRVTKMLIRSAFADLLRKKPVESISIKELSAAAGIHRGTFYAHYQSVFDLLERIEDEFLREIDVALEKLLPQDGSGISPLKISTELFQLLKDNADLCAVTLGDYGDREFTVRLLNLGREKCVQAYAKHFANASPGKIEYFYAFAGEGCIGILRKWFQEGMGTSAEEIAAMAEDLILYGAGWLSRDSAH